MPKKASGHKKVSDKDNAARERPGERGSLSASSREVSQSKESRRKESSVHDPKSPNADT